MVGLIPGKEVRCWLGATDCSDGRSFCCIDGRYIAIVADTDFSYRIYYEIQFDALLVHDIFAWLSALVVK